jgi:uroporphyrinogen decarboxylase
VGLLPSFEWKVLEDRGDHELAQQGDGVVVLRKKYMGSIPHHHSHLLVDRESWRKHYKPRLDPSNPARYPQDWAAALAEWQDPNRTHVSVAWGGSLYGWLRDWMGMENISMVVYDDPAWFGEMVETLGDCTFTVLSEALRRGARFEGCSMWEDMCYSGGPLLSPQHFKEYLVPQYRRITDLLRRHGCDVIWVDCDGKIDDLLPLWLEAGVNCMFPIEIGTWGADPIAYRRQYGRDLLIMGGFDKHVLAQDRRAIEREVHRLTPLVEEGGFIGFADHRVPPDVPYENYLHYLRTVRKAWGKGVNLKPLLADDPAAAQAGASA